MNFEMLEQLEDIDVAAEDSDAKDFIEGFAIGAGIVIGFFSIT